MNGEAHLKRHPFGRVPAFAHADFRFPEPAFEPADPRAAARMNQIIGINDWYFFPKVAGGDRRTAHRGAGSPRNEDR
jgi:glutathione S-transferase